MNFAKRAFLYVSRKKGKTLSLFLLIFIVAVFLISCFGVLNASERLSKDIRTSLGAAFYIRANTAVSMNESGKSEVKKNSINISQKEIDEIMETGERGSIDSFKAALEWCLKEKIKLVHMSVGTTNYIDAKKIENIIKQMVSNKMILCAALSNTNFPTWPACFDGVFGVRNYIAKLQEKEISVSKSFPFSEMNSIQLNFDDVLKKIVGKEYKSNSFAAPIITVLLICYLRKNKKGSYQDAKKFIMNHINKCIYEKELEWNGIVNNKAWSRVLNKKRCVF